MPLVRNVYGNNLAARIIKEKKVYYLYNGHGDVTGLVSENGDILATYYYDAFGNIIENNENVENPFKYAGYEYDEETGNYYIKSRYYDPEIARFLSEDTYRGKDNDPLSLNLYTYCHNNPIMYIDPDGHRPKESNGFGETPEQEKLSHTLNAIAKTKGSDGLLRKGTQNEDVRKLQILLNEADANIAEDGIFGKNTEAAVKEFQQKVHIGIDGIVGPETWAELKEYKAYKDNERSRQEKEAREAANRIEEEKKRVEEGRKAAEDLLIAMLRASIKADLEKRAKEIRTTASVVASVLPVIGDVKAAQEATTGYDIITNEKLTPTERVISGVAAVVPWVSGSAARTAIHGTEEAIEVIAKHGDDVAKWGGKSNTPMLKNIQLLGNKGAAEPKSIPGQGYHKEVYANKSVKVQDAVNKWDEFLGAGEYNNIHPRTGLQDADRIFSADGKRSIRFGSHKMNSKPSKFHYHEETWTHDPINNVMNVDNTVVRVPHK